MGGEGCREGDGAREVERGAPQGEEGAETCRGRGRRRRRSREVPALLPGGLAEVVLLVVGLAPVLGPPGWQQLRRRAAA